MMPSPIDLFGEVPVTLHDLDMWCDYIGKAWPSEWRKEWYIKNWNVADKVRRGKLDGSFFRLV
jgi:hypothetical protein